VGGLIESHEIIRNRKVDPTSLHAESFGSRFSSVGFATYSACVCLHQLDGPGEVWERSVLNLRRGCNKGQRIEVSAKAATHQARCPSQPAHPAAPARI
jgi:hypothetical protein